MWAFSQFEEIKAERRPFGHVFSSDAVRIAMQTE
jgi:hypothetical protein